MEICLFWGVIALCSESLGLVDAVKIGIVENGNLFSKFFFKY